MRPLVYTLAMPPRPVATRCCDDVPPPIARREQSRPTLPKRGARKLAIALSASIRVFRRQLRQPAIPAVRSGTPVVTVSGRKVGTVRDVVVELRSGRTSYAVATEEPHDERGRVLLLPREALRDRTSVAVVDDRDLRLAERQIA